MEKRYSRNRIYLRAEEQLFIKSHKILLAGAGIGSNIAECALRFGFESLTIVDGDLVEESNLNRQNYQMQDIGKPKAEALKKRLLNINPQANIMAISTFIDDTNVEELLKGQDIAVNALDFKSEIPFVFDECCQKHHIPVIHPYNLGWIGLVVVVMPGGNQLREVSDNWENFEVKFVEHLIHDFNLKIQPESGFEEIITQFKNEKEILPPPQLSVASWIVAGLCTNLMFYIATGLEVKQYPQFYMASALFP
ncbi:ThiF family adenylyltransferase [Limibacterium fermenti]|uniref:ThiF family adenylyltransferase n=1 Tax=Limibacterium fermenti TaxID=3229863 RepID=UPI003A78DDC7